MELISILKHLLTGSSVGIILFLQLLDFLYEDVPFNCKLILL